MGAARSKQKRKEFHRKVNRMGFRLELMQTEQRERMGRVRALMAVARDKQARGEVTVDEKREIVSLTGEAMRVRRLCAKQELMHRNLKMVEAQLDTIEAMKTTQEGLEAAQSLLKSMGLESKAKDAAKSMQEMAKMGLHADNLFDTLSEESGWGLLEDSMAGVEDDEDILQKLEQEFALDLHSFMPSVPRRLPVAPQEQVAAQVEEHKDQNDNPPK